MEFETGDGEIRCVGPGNALRLDFDRRLMLQFRGSLITSDAPGIATTRYRPYVSLTIAIFAGVLANVRGGGARQTVPARLPGFRRSDPSIKLIPP